MLCSEYKDSHDNLLHPQLLFFFLVMQQADARAFSRPSHFLMTKALGTRLVPVLAQAVQSMGRKSAFWRISQYPLDKYHKKTIKVTMVIFPMDGATPQILSQYLLDISEY